MESIDALAVKANKAAQYIKRLQSDLQRVKDENIKLSTELAYFKGEVQRNKASLAHYNVLRKNTDAAALKIERLLKKIEAGNHGKT